MQCVILDWIPDWVKIAMKDIIDTTDEFQMWATD